MSARAQHAAVGDPRDNGRAPERRFSLVSLEAFAAVDEPGAGALVGTEDAALIPEDGDVMVYGDGGASKTTLAIDLACHLAAGKDWLGVHVARPARVLVIENEGPRPLFRKKLRRKLAGWPGPPLNERISVHDHPWGEFSFADPEERVALATAITENEIDVLIVGPVTRSGMDEAGTLQQVRDFMRLVTDLRALTRRRVAVILVHHENKGGAVSGAWEGAGDTLLHVTSHAPGATTVFVQNARWDSTHHKTTLELAWTDGEGFAIKEERDLPALIDELLADGVWRIAEEIAAPTSAKPPGVGANRDRVRECLEGDPARFRWVTGDDAKALGRSPRATLWQLAEPAQSPERVERVGPSLAGVEGTRSPARPLRESGSVGRAPAPTPEPAQTPERVRAGNRTDAEVQALLDRIEEKAG